MTITIDAGIEVGKGIIMGDNPVVTPGITHTVTTNGNARVSTARVKFGTGSYTSNGLNGYLSVTPYTDFAFGTSDFTIEFWFYPTVVNIGMSLIGFRPKNVQGLYPFVGIDVNGVVAYYTNSAYRILSPDNTIVANTWNSIALSRSSGSTKLFANGVQVGPTYADTNNYLAGSCIIGANDYFQNGTYPIKGFMDEIRISDIARYTTDYTPATQPFTTDSSTLLLLHCDGTNNSTTFIDSSNTV